MSQKRATGSKAVPPVGLEKASTRRKKARRRAARGNGGGSRKMPHRWELKERSPAPGESRL